jgi:hypothetical protein
MKKLGRGIAPPILNLAVRRSCQLHARTAAAPRVKCPVPIGYHVAWTWSKSGNFDGQINFLLLPIAGWFRAGED